MCVGKRRPESKNQVIVVHQCGAFMFRIGRIGRANIFTVPCYELVDRYGAPKQRF